MNGPQDLGGRHGFGPVIVEEDEPVFHSDGERHAFALVLAMGATGTWTLDRSRRARESLPPAQYLASTYYEIWLAALENLLEAYGLVSRDERLSGHAIDEPRPVKRVLKGADVSAAMAKGGPVDRPAKTPARFAVGDRVASHLTNPTGHTRLPGYARGRPGTIYRVHGVHVFPDANATGTGENPHWLYSVRFAAVDLWGPATTAADVFIDLWEPYLEPA